MRDEVGSWAMDAALQQRHCKATTHKVIPPAFLSVSVPSTAYGDVVARVGTEHLAPNLLAQPPASGWPHPQAWEQVHEVQQHMVQGSKHAYSLDSKASARDQWRAAASSDLNNTKTATATAVASYSSSICAQSAFLARASSIEVPRSAPGDYSSPIGARSISADLVCAAGPVAITHTHTSGACHEPLRHISKEDCRHVHPEVACTTATPAHVLPVGSMLAPLRPPRMYSVYKPVGYPDHSSVAALDHANHILSHINIPGITHFRHVHYDSQLAQAGRCYQFTAFTVALGSSYFQRLLSVLPGLEYAVRYAVAAGQAPSFEHFLEDLPACTHQRWQWLRQQYGNQKQQQAVRQHDAGVAGSSSTEVLTMGATALTCLYLACKVADRVPQPNLLQHMLGDLYRGKVPYAAAYNVEAKCLQGLGFRLGPYFSTDALLDCDGWP